MVMSSDCGAPPANARTARSSRVHRVGGRLPRSAGEARLQTLLAEQAARGVRGLGHAVRVEDQAVTAASSSVSLA